MLLFLFSISVVGLLLWGVWKRGRIYQFPFLGGVLFAAFMLPQLVAISKDATLPVGAYERVALMAALCAPALYFGYKLPSTPFRSFHWRYDRTRLFHATAILIGVGVGAQVLLWQLPPVVWEGQPSGIVVAVLFFTDIMDYGFIIASLVYARTGDRRYLLFCLVAIYFYYPSVVKGIRRAEITQIALVGGMSAWFGRRWIPDRRLVTPLIIVLAIFGTTSISDLRRSARDGGLTVEDIRSVPWMENVRETTEPQQDMEMKAAAYQMAVIDRLDIHDYGLYHWNRLVFRYVPAQLLGRSFKEAMYLRVNGEHTMIKANDLNGKTYEHFRYRKKTGLTTGGITDAYGSFWYFGFIKFAIVAAIMKRLYLSARLGSFTHQVFYLVLIVPAMHIVSHPTNWFVGKIPHMMVFLLPALLYARGRSSEEPKQPSSSTNSRVRA